MEWWELHWLCHHRIPSNILSTVSCPAFTAVLKSHLYITFKRNKERASFPISNYSIVSFVPWTAVDYFASSLYLVNWARFFYPNLDEESFLMINEVPCMWSGWLNFLASSIKFCKLKTPFWGSPLTQNPAALTATFDFIFFLIKIYHDMQECLAHMWDEWWSCMLPTITWD